MDKNAYQTELNQVRFTPAGRETLTNALMRRAAPAPRRVNWAKRGLAAGIAAVLLVGSAMAVAGPVWNYFFGNLNEDQQAVIDILSQILPAAESNGTVMTPLEAFGDEDYYYLLLEITPPEGTILPNYGKEEGFYQLFNPETLEDMTLLDGAGNDIRGNWDYDWLPRSDRSDPLVAAIRLWPREGVNYSDGTDKFLRIPGLWVQSPDKEYTPVLTGSWEFNIGAYTGGIESRELDVTGVTTSNSYCESLILESMSISPLGMHWSYHHGDLPEGVEYPEAETTVVMEDGSEVHLDSTIGGWNPDEKWAETYAPFESPVDLSKAVSIRWGTAEIPLN